MRKIFKEFFYISKHERIREKVMLTRVATTVVVVLMCLAAMSFTAYAYFSHNVVSGSTTITTANFEIDVLVEATDQYGNKQQIQTNTSNHKTFLAELEAGKTYTVTITPTANNTARTGFIVVKSDGCAKVYNTQQLGVDTNAVGGKTTSIKFNLTVSAKAGVIFQTNWGTSSLYSTVDNNELYITQNETVNMIIENTISSVDDSDNTEAESTKPAETTVSTPETTKPAETQAPAPAVTQPAETQAPAPAVTQPAETQAPAPEVTQPAETQAPTPEVTQPAETQAPTPEVTQPTETQAPTPEVTQPA